MNIERVFAERKKNHFLNTSYPLNPNEWTQFRSEKELDFSADKEMSFYIHIPFCQHLCKFCEYVRMTVPNQQVQSHYIEVLRRDIVAFVNKHPFIILNGFDIGGGTPTALEDKAFAALLDLYADTLQRVPQTSDFEPSIEATFQTISKRKAQLIASRGIRRVSLGVQSSIGRVQRCNGRVNVTIEYMNDTVSMLHKEGIQKVNIDLMYGLAGQEIEDVVSDLEVIRALQPEQVTLYELRPNLLRAVNIASKEYLYNCYCTLFNGLLAMGYWGEFGQNTFTKDITDHGLSSYLRHRMLDFSAYKGFGISAQSLSSSGISYNLGKQSGKTKSMLSQCSFPEESVYQLPPQELFAKYVSISAYCGQLSISVASKILNDDFTQRYRDIIDFCVSNNYFSLNGDCLRITKKGFIYYGAIFSLFSTLPTH